MAKATDIVWLDDDGIIHVRNSERGTFNKCPQRWWWAWRNGLRPKETAKALWFGTAIHAALADYYQPGRKRSKDYIDKFREIAGDESEYMRINLGGVDEDEYVDMVTLGEQMLTGYVDRWEGDRHWDVIATEQEFEIAIPFVGAEHKSVLTKRIMRHYGDHFILNGTFDGVYRDRHDKVIKLMEHKTAGTVSTRHLPMDNQAGTYWMVASTIGHQQGWLKKGDQIREITYNFLRKAMPDPRPKDAEGYALNAPTKDHYIDALTKDGYEPPVGPRGGLKWPTIPVMQAEAEERGLVVLGERSKRQPAPLYERHPVKRTTRQRRTQLQRLQSEVRLMAAMVMGEVDVTKSPSRDTCVFCPFQEMCELHESGNDWLEFRDALFRSTDPYEDHRKSASVA